MNWIEPNVPNEDYKKYHYCELECRPHLYGAAIDYCYQDLDGKLFVENGEYGSQVNFCPVCGYEAKVIMGERTGANQNICPDYLKMVGGINEELLGKASNGITLSIKTMLFMGESYYPNGGWKDFKGFFDDVESAKKWVEENSDNLFCDWMHIVHDNKIVLYAFLDVYKFGPKFQWSEEE